MNRLKIILISLFGIIIFYSCFQSEENNPTQWEVISISRDNPFLKEAKLIEFKEDSIVFTNNSMKKSFIYILSNDNLLIKTAGHDYLLNLENRSDTTMTIIEKYSDNPILINVKKLN